MSVLAATALDDVGPAAQRPRRSLNGWSIALVIYATAFYLFLYTPIAIIVLLSFNSSEVTGLPFRGVTTHWYEVVFARPDLMAALFNSICLGLIAALRPRPPHRHG